MYDLKEIARKRNWGKLRILGSSFSRDFSTKREIELMEQLDTIRKELLETWDENTKSILSYYKSKNKKEGTKL